MTQDIFSSGGAAIDERSERAQRAVRAFRAMQPGLSGYARAITGRKDVQVELAQGIPRTDGKKIYFKPPIALGDLTPHDRSKCERRDRRTKLMLCPACRVREEVLISIYHEIAHIVFGTFEEPTEKAKIEAVERAVAEVPGKFAAKVREAFERIPDYKKNDYLNLSSLISPYLPILVNALEDARVDDGMFKARKGTKVMFDAYVQSIFANGVEEDDGSTTSWADKPLNSQALIGVFVLACRYKYEGWFHPEVEAALGDARLRELAGRVDTLRSAAGSYNLAFPILARLRELGFCKLPEEEPEPEQEPEPEETPEDEEQQDAGDDSPESEGTDSDEAEADEAEAGSGDDSEGDPQDDGGSADGDDGADSEDPDGDSHAAGSGDGEPESEPSDDPEGDGEPDGEPRADAGDDGAGEAEPDDRGDDESDSSEADAGGSEPSDDSDGAPDGEGADEAEGEAESTGSGDGAADSQAPGGAGGPDREPSDSDELEDGAEVPGADDGMAGGSSDGVPSAVPEEEGELTDEDGDSDGEDREEDGDSDAGDSPEPSEAEEDLDDVEVIDSGADEGEGGDESNRPEYGNPEQSLNDVQVFGKHEAAVDDKTPAEVEDDKALDLAIIQGQYFEKPSANVSGVREHKYGQPLYEAGRDISVAWTDQYGDASYYKRELKRLGIDTDLDIPETILGPALNEMRRAFSDNARASHERHLKSGKINAKVLGKRAPFGDQRLFQKKRLPGKRSYAVVLGIDISGSTVGVNIALAKRAAMAQAELCSRMGIDFAIYAHTANGSWEWSGYTDLWLDMYEIKSFDQPWADTAKEALKAISSDAENLDGHGVEYYRKIVERHPATDKIILYYSDGKMPAANHDEELEILQREIAYCKAKQITLLGVGIRTDSPRRHGLDTVQVDDDSDVPKVVKHLQSALLHNR